MSSSNRWKNGLASELPLLVLSPGVPGNSETRRSKVKEADDVGEVELGASKKESSRDDALRRLDLTSEAVGDWARATAIDAVVEPPATAALADLVLAMASMVAWVERGCGCGMRV